MIGSMCSGYGGLDLAVEPVFGQRVAWHCEIEDAPSRVLEAHWPGVPNLRDLTEVDWGGVEPVEIIAAGYPCTPFSHAGQRRGADDERHLWPYVAEAVRRIRPRLVVLENVAGHRSLGFDVVLGDLAALRYDVRWASVRAADVGAPHGRERVFIVASDSADVGHERGGRARHGRPGPADRRSDSAANAHGPGSQGGESAGRRLMPARVVAADTTGDGRDERRPEPARLIRGSDAAERGASPTTDTEDGIESREPTRDGRYQPVVSPGTRTGARDSARRTAERVHQLGRDPRPEWGPYLAAIERWERALGRTAPPPTEPGPRGGQRLAPRFVEWMMGLPAGWVTDVDAISRNEMLRMLGNGVVPQQAEAALRMLTGAVLAA